MTDTPRKRFSGRDVLEAMAAARKEFGVERGLIAHEVVARRDVGELEDPNALVEIEAWVDPTRTPLVSPESPSRGHGGDRGGDRGGRGGDRGGRSGGGGRGGGGDRGGCGASSGAPSRDRGDRGGRSDRDSSFRAPREERVVELVPVDPVVLLPPKDVTDADTILTMLGAAMVKGLGLDLALEKISRNEAGVRIHYQGSDAGLLTENEAQGLEALQYLVNRILQKDGRLEAKLTLDAGGWREENERHLMEEAKRIAHEVLQSGGDRALLQPLSPYERRLIHMTLADTPGVKTYSSGTGYERRLHIAKADE